jgi:DNA-binding transcriptional MocR family regulator
MSKTIWSPTLRTDIPIYQAVADALERDISAGILRDGERLPTHRDLADKLGVTTLTITRAYQEASRRGLIDAGVGRGTFVRRAAGGDADLPRDGALLDLTRNFISGSESLELDSRVLTRITEQLRSPVYHPVEGTPRHRAAGASWMQRFGVNVPAERVVVVPGAQHAILTLLTVLCSPGDKVMVEELTYPGLKAMADLLHLELVPLQLDDDGLIPKSFEKGCRTSGANVLYVIPNFQNPMGSVMPEARRREIAAIAKKHGVTIIEDDVYGFLREASPRPIAAILPEQTCYITSCSKSVSPSLRLGYVAAPEDLVPRLAASLATTISFTSTIAAEVFTTVFESGEAERVIASKRKLVETRRRIASRLLSGLDVHGDASSPHVWLQLSKQTHCHDVIDKARARGVALASPLAFAVDSDAAPNAIRICLGALEETRNVELGLRTIADIICAPRTCSAPIV